MGMISKIIQKERETNNKVAQTGRSTKTQKKEKQQNSDSDVWDISSYSNVALL